MRRTSADREEKRVTPRTTWNEERQEWLDPHNPNQRGQTIGQTVLRTVSAYGFGHFCSSRFPRPTKQSADRANQLSESPAVPRG